MLARAIHLAAVLYLVMVYAVCVFTLSLMGAI